MTDWTLEGELCGLAGYTSLDDALVKLGLISSKSVTFRLRPVSSSWERRGSETYCFEFVVDESPNLRKHAMLKACVAFSPSGAVEHILETWLTRRRHLASMGVSTPVLYGYGTGILIEEFVPFTLQDALQNSDNWGTIRSLCKYAAVLSKCGYEPISPFDDLRSRGSDVVVVDFGQDLGPAKQAERPKLLTLDTMFSFLQSRGIALQGDRLDELRGLYAKHGGHYLN